MSNIDKQALRKRYSAKPTPKCDICGARMTMQRMSGSRVTYGCSGAIYDETGCHYAEGRSLADDHYEQSRVTVTDESDPDVLALLDELEAKNKRIAELERNEIREEGNQFLVVRHPGKLPVVKYCAGDLEGFLRQLLEHDPMGTIDIITHRYYGVGGQWVQDADEYLQMMAAAAGKGEAS
ncbi:ead/Ea22-like family protein [Enterobacter hormaechei subsp. xiangfangensis]|nr:ead/Ea22-like family protein [Enterobacter hormaechei subsp. xiangfangensis]